jgi:hypothetical protein
MSNLLQVTVVRSKWNGNTLAPVEGSKLLTQRSEPKMCCLGFACKAAGVPDEQFAGLGYVHELGKHVPVVLMPLVDVDDKPDDPRSWGQSEISRLLTHANDNDYYQRQQSPPVFETMAQKEAYLIEQGRLAGIEFSFVD